MVYMLGVFTGALLCGTLSDRFGRRTAFLGFALVQVVFLNVAFLLLGLGYIPMMLTYFVIGALGDGTYLTSYVLRKEDAASYSWIGATPNLHNRHCKISSTSFSQAFNLFHNITIISAILLYKIDIVGICAIKVSNINRFSDGGGGWISKDINGSVVPSFLHRRNVVRSANRLLRT